MDKNETKWITEIEQRSKQNAKRLDNHDKKIEELSDVYVALTKVNDKVDAIDTDVKDIKKDMNTLKEKPAKRYEQIVGYVLSALIGGIVGFILFKIGL